MGCDFIKLGDGTSVVMCGPGRGSSRKRCTVTGCRAPATHLCDFPLQGAANGRTCSKSICRGHAMKQIEVTAFPRMVDVQLVPGGEVHRVLIPGEVGETIDFCPAHDKLVVRKESA